MSIFIADENGSNRQLKYKVANVYYVYIVYRTSITFQ